MDCKKTQNAAKCPCPSQTCGRRGACCDCISGHLAKQTLPACCFPADKSKDRTFTGFAKAWGLI